jgi:hypothetical protein
MPTQGRINASGELVSTWRRRHNIAQRIPVWVRCPHCLEIFALGINSPLTVIEHGDWVHRHFRPNDPAVPAGRNRDDRISGAALVEYRRQFAAAHARQESDRLRAMREYS